MSTETYPHVVAVARGDYGFCICGQDDWGSPTVGVPFGENCPAALRKALEMARKELDLSRRDLARAIAERDAQVRLTDDLGARVAELEATLANERGETVPGDAVTEGWKWGPRANRDAFGIVLDRYHAWLWGPDDTGFEVLREPDGRWSVALELDRTSHYPTARDAIKAANAARKG